jgi:hypothetical protein
MIKILTILVKDRIKEAGRTQNLLSNYGHIINSRLGFHEVSADKCSRVGVIILHLTGEEDEWTKFESELSLIGGIEFKSITFDI